MANPELSNTSISRTSLPQWTSPLEENLQNVRIAWKDFIAFSKPEPVRFRVSYCICNRSFQFTYWPWFFQPSWKHMLVNLDHIPKDPGEHSTDVWNHRPVHVMCAKLWLITRVPPPTYMFQTPPHQQKTAAAKKTDGGPLCPSVTSEWMRIYLYFCCLDCVYQLRKVQKKCYILNQALFPLNIGLWKASLSISLEWQKWTDLTLISVEQHKSCTWNGKNDCQHQGGCLTGPPEAEIFPPLERVLPSTAPLLRALVAQKKLVYYWWAVQKSFKIRFESINSMNDSVKNWKLRPKVWW